MPFDTTEIISGVGTRFTQLKIIHAIASNPIYMALCIVAIMMIIIAIVFRDVEGKQSLTTLTLRAGFWAFMATTGAIFVNNRIMMQEVTNNTKKSAYEELFDYNERFPTSVRSSTTGGGNVPSPREDNVDTRPSDIPTINMSGL